MDATGWYLLLVYLMHIVLILPVTISLGRRYSRDEKVEVSSHSLRYLYLIGISGTIYHTLALVYSLFTGSWSWNWGQFIR